MAHDMSGRVARFDELRANRQAFVDSKLPGHERENFRIIGKGVTEDPADRPAITAPHDFNVGGIRAKPGHGAALHSHLTVEIFIPFSGRWEVYYGDDGGESVVLGPLDTFSVPAGVMRGFRNVGDDEAFLLTIIGGAEPGKVTWSPEVLAAASASGVTRNEAGNLEKETSV